MQKELVREDVKPAAALKRITGREWLALAGFIAGTQLVGGLGAIATARGLKGWYPRLEKPSFNPPNYVFGPVWTTLYAVMGVSAWMIWRKRNEPGAERALGLFALQLGLNAVWSPIFFGLRAPGAALADILVLDGAIAAYMSAARRVSTPAAALMVPYLGWSGFATVLNGSIWWLNGPGYAGAPAASFGSVGPSSTFRALIGSN